MGLDMYLKQDIYIGAKYEHRKVTGVCDIKIPGEKINIPFDRISSIEVDIAYWRKANHIHHWFTKDLDDDVRVEMKGEKILELVEDCKKVLESLEGQNVVDKVKVGTTYETVHTIVDGEDIDEIISNMIKNEIDKNKEFISIREYENIDLALEILPPTEGFFFGGADIDEYYKYDLESTIEQLKDIDPNEYYIYEASY